MENIWGHVLGSLDHGIGFHKKQINTLIYLYVYYWRMKFIFPFHSSLCYLRGPSVVQIPCTLKKTLPINRCAETP